MCPPGWRRRPATKNVHGATGCRLVTSRVHDHAAVIANGALIVSALDATALYRLVRARVPAGPRTPSPRPPSASRA
jgi:hypothetical protein